MRASGSPFQSYKSKRILSFAKFICSSVTQLKPPALKNDVSAFCRNQLQWKVMGRFWNSIRQMWSVCTKIALMEKYFERKHSETPVCCLRANLPTVNLVPRASFPLTSGRKTRALGASQSRSQRPRSFWLATGIATSGRVQLRKSAIHGLPVTLSMLRVKSDKWWWWWW